MVQLDNVVELMSVSNSDTIVDPDRLVESITGVELSFVVELESSVESVKCRKLDVGVDEDVVNGLCESTMLDNGVAMVSLSSDEVRRSVIDVVVEVMIPIAKELRVVVEISVKLLPGIVSREVVEVDTEAGKSVFVRRLNGLRPPVPHVAASTPHNVAATKIAKPVLREPILTLSCSKQRAKVKSPSSSTSLPRLLYMSFSRANRGRQYEKSRAVAIRGTVIIR